jgi:hypothetical protein
VSGKKGYALAEWIQVRSVKGEVLKSTFAASVKMLIVKFSVVGLTTALSEDPAFVENSV